jgi:uncharacterized protein (DUF1330 family)
MPAYWMGRSKVTDPTRFKGYADLAPGVILQHGGKFLAAGGRSAVLEGSPPHEAFFVVEFPSFEAASACFHSPEYQHAASLRAGAGIVEVVIVDGAAGK